MAKKVDEGPGFDLPPDVKNLPPELEGARLTFAQKKKDEKRRDQLMRLHGSAARLSPEESNLAHAYIRVANYKQEVDRLTALSGLSLKQRGRRRLSGIRGELERARHNLADALIDTGQLPEAYSALSELTGKLATHRRRHIYRLRQAISIPDDQHCPCAPESKHIERRLWVPERQEFVDFVSCPCGHLNATTTLPVEMLNLRRARAQATKGSNDEFVLNLAKHPTMTG